jgi:phage-related protein
VRKSVKPVEFRGGALADLRAFPADARREAGYQLDRVQHGSDPDDWKPMKTIGPGVREIRIRGEDGAYRVIYVAILRKRFSSFTASERNPGKRAARTSRWPRAVTRKW